MRHKTGAASPPRSPAFHPAGPSASAHQQPFVTAAGTSPLRAAIQKLAFGQPLTGAEIADAFSVIMRGEASETHIAAILMGLQVRGMTPATVAGVVRALRAVMIHLPSVNAGELVDTCGTGGGTILTFNISTAAAFVASGAGVRIAKHGNRSFTSRCGSADVLEALGIRLDVPLATMTKALEENGMAFMFAPAMHPAIKNVGPVRRELAVPTVMNVVGPLANPAGATRHVLGVADLSRARVIAGALVELGTPHSLVVHGEPGLDEISPIGVTHVLEVRGNSIKEFRLDPVELGYRGIDAAGLTGGSPEENARIIETVLNGGGPRGARVAVVLNAAAAILVSGRVTSFGDAVNLAESAIDDGSAAYALDRLRSAYSEAA